MRTVKEQEYAARCNEILDVAQGLVLTKGFARMTIQDLLHELGISKGALYHYFDSKSAVLEALVERMQQEAEAPLIPLVQDNHLSAIEKLQHFFAVLDNSRSAQKAFIADLARVWFADENTIVREKVDNALLQRRAPLLTEIVYQGIREGVFKTRYPAQVGEIILSLSRAMGNTVVHLMLATNLEDTPENAERIEQIVATYAAHVDAIERVLWIASPVLPRPDTATVRGWLRLDRN